MSTSQESPAWKPRSETRYVNQDVPRVDGPVKVTGRARYTHDIRLPGMLIGRALLSPYPVVKVTLNLEAARAVPGVEAVIAEIGDGFTSRLGQPLAMLAARTPEAAADGLRALDPKYEFGDWVLTPEDAKREGAPNVSRRGNVTREQTDGRRDDAEAALETSDVVVEATYTAPVQFHACLETHGSVCDFRGGDEATIYCSTQFTHGVAGDAAEILDLPENKVHCIVHHMGGGFGAKFGLDIPGRLACLLSKETGKPVHFMFKRADEFLSGGNRSGSRQTMRAGATKDGRMLGMVADIDKYGGVNGGSNPGQPYIYHRNTRDGYAQFHTIRSVHTHTDGNRAMRAPGHPQANFATESMVDELAYALRMDPVEFRKKNLVHADGSPHEVYHRQLDRVAREIGWNEHAHRTGPPAKLADKMVGIGFGVAAWGSGGGASCEVDVKIARDGSVISAVGSQDLGTGTRTYVASIVAEELGIPLERVEAQIGDSRLGFGNPSGGSTTVPSLAPAVKVAAFEAAKAFTEAIAKATGWSDVTLGVNGVSNGSETMSWNDACSMLPPGGISVRGTYDASLSTAGVHGAQAAKVEVDTRTGETRVLEMVAIQDVGMPLNRLATRSQINGGMIQGMGYGLWEERVLDPVLGVQLNLGMEEYKIPGSMDMPRMTAILDDDDTRLAVTGVGEPAVVPGQSAIANAIFNATGVRLRDLPLSRDKIIAGLANLG
ncbi:MAG: xanthine dehydrogenase family protein molybdopterin-binding subunit [Planctomycetota bacterium]